MNTVAMALSAETRRQLERLGAQLQQRRSELVTALQGHVDLEVERLQCLAVAGAGAATATELVQNALEQAAKENRQLCDVVQRALKGDQAPAELCSGSRCRARWMDWAGPLKPLSPRALCQPIEASLKGLSHF